MNDLRVDSWSELHERLFAGSWRPALRRFRSAFAYRGAPDTSDDLSTGLSRLRGTFAANESHLLRNFRKYAGPTNLPDDSLWNWLALGQHHGLPTRLLDWTYSPYVALHFATQNMAKMHLDGVIWCLDYAQLHALLPAKLKRILKDEGSDVFTAEMLDRAARTLPELARLRQRGREFALFLEPPSLDARIVNQFALFSLMSSATAHMRPWLSAHPRIVQRIILPARLKWEVRDKLDQANITERVLFPGLDGLTRWLLRYYAPHTAGDVTRHKPLR